MFAINTKANELGADDVKNKLRTLYAGAKTDLVIGNIAKTFKALCEYADFSGEPQPEPPTKEATVSPSEAGGKDERKVETADKNAQTIGRIAVSALQYHVNIVLPETRDQAVYDAIFKSLREHLG